MFIDFTLDSTQDIPSTFGADWFVFKNMVIA